MSQIYSTGDHVKKRGDSATLYTVEDRTGDEYRLTVGEGDHLRTSFARGFELEPASNEEAKPEELRAELEASFGPPADALADIERAFATVGAKGFEINYERDGAAYVHVQISSAGDAVKYGWGITFQDPTPREEVDKTWHRAIADMLADEERKANTSAGGMDLSRPPAPEGQQAAATEKPTFDQLPPPSDLEREDDRDNTRGVPGRSQSDDDR